ncbi:MAG: hypothetical protein KDA20_05525 [Phycisphaerales bacterium]|nr:hypothetical protein [Phycisphaerales bacterium]
MELLASEFGQFVTANAFWVIMGSVGVVAILSGTASSIINTRLRERSRREIAAYIAEGSMTPEQGERLMIAANPDKD